MSADLFIVFEYDPAYVGGNYDGVGEFAYVPVEIVDWNEPELAFEEHTGFNRIHIIHFSNEAVAGGSAP